MNLLAVYERICTELAEATQVREVLQIRDDLDHVKLHARKIRDRAMLAEATVFQMRAERYLGRLLAAAKDAGELADRQKGRPKEGDPARPATLKEIGVEPKLSSRAQRAAALDDIAWDTIETTTRDKIRSGQAILVDPIRTHEQTTDLAGRRAAHAARTLNGGCVEDLGKLALSGYRAKFQLLDPQWKFLTRSAAGDGRSANVHYKTEEVDKIKQLPVGELAADHCAMGMWMVDWCPQDALDLIKHYGFTHITTLLTWVKTNGDGALDIWDNSTWHMGQGYWTRANPEQCYFATKGNPKRLHADVRQLMFAPLMEHSRKPDEQYPRIERLVEGPYLELQARRPRKGWMSWGDELEFSGVAA